jgi:hypothetical protein
LFVCPAGDQVESNEQPAAWAVSAYETAEMPMRENLHAQIGCAALCISILRWVRMLFFS